MNTQRTGGSRAKSTVLVLTDFYLPGYKGGGPIKTIAGIVSQLGDYFDFKILTRDRDRGDAIPFPNVIADSWQRVGMADVYYCSPEQLTLNGLRRIINSTEHDVLYLNSFFSPAFSILPLVLRRFGLIQQRSLILAPRGEFSPGAIRLKHLKKRTFLRLAIFLGLHRDILWQASTDFEREYIKRWFKCEINKGDNHTCVRVAENLIPECVTSNNNEHCRSKVPGSLNVVFLSRISPKKNLDFALNVLKKAEGKICFDIYGPAEDADYWAKCQCLMADMPDYVRVNYKGPVAAEQVAETFAQYDLFFFPTRGENFGHVILEALSAGCPVLISDQTPWKNLEEKKAGWDIPLNKPHKFLDVLEELVRMDSTEFGVFSRGARELASHTANSEDALAQNRELFSYAVSQGTRRRQP